MPLRKWCVCGDKRCKACIQLDACCDRANRDLKAWALALRNRVYHEAKLDRRFNEDGRLVRWD